MWKKVGVCADINCAERLWHAGLSEDGSKCFVAGFDDENYIVWDVKNERVIWEDKEQTQPPLEEWIDEKGFITIADEIVKGSYRIFGLDVNFPKIIDENQKLKLLKGSENFFELFDYQSSKVLANLEYEDFSGDWAFASFSENGKVVAIIEPYSVTFYSDEY